jgi:hypothetical protein
LEPLITKFPGLRITDRGELLKVGNTKGDIVLRRDDKLVILELKTKLDQAALQQAFGRAYMMKREKPKALFLLVAFESAYREEIAQIFRSEVCGIVMLDEIYRMTEGDMAATGSLSRMVERIGNYLTAANEIGDHVRKARR